MIRGANIDSGQFFTRATIKADTEPSRSRSAFYGNPASFEGVQAERGMDFFFPIRLFLQICVITILRGLQRGGGASEPPRGSDGRGWGAGDGFPLPFLPLGSRTLLRPYLLGLATIRGSKAKISYSVG